MRKLSLVFVLFLVACGSEAPAPEDDGGVGADGSGADDSGTTCPPNPNSCYAGWTYQRKPDSGVGYEGCVNVPKAGVDSLSLPACSLSGNNGYCYNHAFHGDPMWDDAKQGGTMYAGDQPKVDCCTIASENTAGDVTTTILDCESGRWQRVCRKSFDGGISWHCEVDTKL